MTVLTHAPPMDPPAATRAHVALEWLALALMAPMLVSGLVFNTYDIALASLPLEILRQLNAPFVLAELVVIVLAARRGFTVPGAWTGLDPAARAAVAVFLASFWIGGAFVSQAAPFAILFNLTYLIHAVFAAAVMHLVAAPDAGSAVRFARVIAAMLLAFALGIAIQFLNPPAGRPVDTIVWQFALPGFISVRLFGAMVAPMLCLIAWLALDRGDERDLRRWIFPAVALAFGLLVWSGTRAGVVGAGFAGTIAVLGFGLRPRTANLVPFLAALAVGGAAAIALVPHGSSDFMLFTSNDAASADSLSGGRLVFWLDAWRAFLTVPLFGAGPGATAWILPAGQFPHIQPHNILLEFLLNWGLIATAAALYLLARVMRAAHRRARRFPQAIPFVLMADCLLVISLFDGTFHFAQHLMIWAAAIGIALAARGRDGPEATSKTSAA